MWPSCVDLQYTGVCCADRVADGIVGDKRLGVVISFETVETNITF